MNASYNWPAGRCRQFRTSRKRRAVSIPAGARVFAAALILQTHPHCLGAKTEFTYHRFELTSCPDTTFSLPRELISAPYVLSSRRSPGASASPAICSAFQPYWLREQGQDGRLFSTEVRVNRQPTCSLDIGWADTRPRGRARSEHSEQVSSLVDTIARRLMRNSNLEPRVAAPSVHRFHSSADARRSCAQAAP